MSYMQNVQWTHSEKVDLLVNVLQSATPDLPSFLLQIIHEHSIYPKWNDIPLPKGRSLHSSQIAFEEMSRLYRQQGRIHQHVPVPYTPNPNIAPAIPQQRFPEQDIYHTQQRALQPRLPRSTDSPAPNVTNGEVPPLLRPLAPEPMESRKKRGRPSKEEVEERDRALAAEGKVYQPKKRSKTARVSAGTQGPDITMQDVPPLQTPPRLTEPKDETSSGKRRARKQQQEGAPTDEQMQATTGDLPSEGSQSVAQSPSDRLLASHRERETQIPSQQASFMSTKQEANE